VPCLGSVGVAVYFVQFLQLLVGHGHGTQSCFVSEGVTDYSSQDKGVVQGSRVGSQVYAFVENMITMWVGATTEGFCCTFPRRDGINLKVEIHTQTHMDDMVVVCSTEEDAANITKKKETKQQSTAITH
jgi:hypothetical protein